MQKEGDTTAFPFGVCLYSEDCVWERCVEVGEVFVLVCLSCIHLSMHERQFLWAESFPAFGGYESIWLICLEDVCDG